MSHGRIVTGLLEAKLDLHEIKPADERRHTHDGTHIRGTNLATPPRKPFLTGFMLYNAVW